MASAQAVAGHPVLAASNAAVAPASAVAATVEAETPVQRYIRYVYEDLFGRAPDPGGLATWTAALASGTPRVAVANAITSSEEFRAGLITDSYDWYLGREPDIGGLRNWLGAMGRGWTISQMESGFIASAEYYAQAGSTDVGWVTDLYTDVLERVPATSEVSGWTQGLRNGTRRDQVAMGFLLSTEHLTTVVDGYYQDLLGRGLDPSGQRTWVGILQGGGRDEAIIGGIIASQEYWNNVLAPEQQTLDHLVLSWGSDTISFGGSQTYTAWGFDVDNNILGDLTSTTVFAVDGDLTACSGATCSPRSVGKHTVTGTDEIDDTIVAVASLYVIAGALDHLVISPASATITAGGSQAYTAEGFDAADNSLGDATPITTFSVGGEIFCSVKSCTFRAVGAQVVLGYAGSVHASAAVEVLYPDAPARSTLFGWGLDAWGQLAPSPSSTADQYLPSRAGTDGSWISVAAGTNHTVGVRSDGTLWGWGNNALGQIGHGGVGSSPTPSRIGMETGWASVTAGNDFSMALKSDGTLWAWGDNTYGTLGNADLGRYFPEPTEVSPGSRWTSVSPGSIHTLAIKADGTLWSWGNGFSGGLGLGDAFGRLTPTKVGLATDWRTVAAGYAFSVAIKSDGTLWAWGNNTSGQLGDGSTAQRLAPEQIGTDTRWASVAAGDVHTVATTTDGALWTWGDNFRGQLGDGSTVRRLAPEQIGTDTGWAAVGAGSRHTVAVKANGTLWAWGDNAHGQVGDGTTVTRSAPTQVGTGTTWTAATAGSFHTLALRP